MKQLFLSTSLFLLPLGFEILIELKSERSGNEEPGLERALAITRSQSLSTFTKATQQVKKAWSLDFQAWALSFTSPIKLASRGGPWVLLVVNCRAEPRWEWNNQVCS
jgi:hypothetical protein